MELSDLFQLSNELPAAPEVALRVIDTIDNPDADLRYVADLVGRDPVLAARVVQQANSSWFRTLRPVESLPGALQVLGMTRVRAMVIAISMQHGFGHIEGFDQVSFWNYSQITAVLARYLAQNASPPVRTHADTVFLVGLLHAVGELVLHRSQPEVMNTFNRMSPVLSVNRAQRQYDMWGYAYPEVGAELARQWHIPKRISQVIQFQGAPELADDVQALSAVVSLAAWRARVFMSGLPVADLAHHLNLTHCERVGLDPNWLLDPQLEPLSKADEAQT